MHNSLTETLCHIFLSEVDNVSLKAENKFFFVKTELAGKHDFIALSETWLSNLDKLEDYKTLGYQLPIHKDRALARVSYGRVVIWISNSIGCKRRSDL